jgi:hypothetical protein
MTGREVDGVLVQWGERLFYPANRIVKSLPAPRFDTMTRRKAAVIRERIEAMVRRVPQVMVKVTGGGRGMGTIAAHFRYISKNGRLAIEDDRGVVRTGKEAVRDMLSMPAGTNAELLKKAAREFAQVEFAGHRYVMVLHEHQANPHVHLSVKAEGISGKRLNPRKANLHRWRGTFAEKLRGWGIEAEATRQTTRGEYRNHEPLWRLKARQDGRLRALFAADKPEPPASRSADAMACWGHILKALATSTVEGDQALAKHVSSFVRGSSAFKQAPRRRQGLEVSMSQEPVSARLDDCSKDSPDPKREH